MNSQVFSGPWEFFFLEMKIFYLPPCFIIIIMLYYIHVKTRRRQMAGRKKKVGDVLTSRVIVLMTDAERAEVEKKAETLKISASAFLRKIMTKEIGNGQG